MISPGGRGVDYKLAENQVIVWICSHPTVGLLKGLIAVFPIRNQSLSPLTESQQLATRRYEAAVQHLQLWIEVWKVWFQTFRASTLSSCSLSSSRSAEVWKERCCCAEPPCPRFTIWWTPMSFNRWITQPYMIVPRLIFLNWTFALGLDRSVWSCGVSSERWLVHLCVLPAGDYNRM